MSIGLGSGRGVAQHGQLLVARLLRHPPVERQPLADLGGQIDAVPSGPGGQPVAVQVLAHAHDEQPAGQRHGLGRVAASPRRPAATRFAGWGGRGRAEGSASARTAVATEADGQEQHSERSHQNSPAGLRPGHSRLTPADRPSSASNANGSNGRRGRADGCLRPLRRRAFALPRTVAPHPHARERLAGPACPGSVMRVTGSSGSGRWTSGVLAAGADLPSYRPRPDADTPPLGERRASARRLLTAVQTAHVPRADELTDGLTPAARHERVGVRQCSVVLIEGDGIGPEVTRAACRVVDAAGVRIDWVPAAAGAWGRRDSTASRCPTKPSTSSASTASPSRGRVPRRWGRGSAASTSGSGRASTCTPASAR